MRVFAFGFLPPADRVLVRLAAPGPARRNIHFLGVGALVALAAGILNPLAGAVRQLVDCFSYEPPSQIGELVDLGHASCGHG